MKNPKVTRAILGGLAGTIAITVMMYWVAPIVLGTAMDVAGMLAGMLAISWEFGMLTHFFLGAVLFPFLYVGFYPLAAGSPCVRGLVWGLVLWVVAELVVMPMAGAGVFHLEQGGLMAAGMSMAGHAAYGALLGWIAGPPPIVSRSEGSRETPAETHENPYIRT